MKLVDLTTAKALQELGYDGEYAKSYTDFGNPTIDITTSLLYPTEIPAPRLDDAAYFLRDKYSISIEPMYAGVWNFGIYDMRHRGLDLLKEIFSDTYDSALEAAVTKAIEIIKSKKQWHRNLK